MRLSRSCRRLAGALVAIACLSGATSLPAGAQPVPHAWLFGSWTGGLFPVPANLAAQACLQQPVVIFTRDVVLRASITDQLYGQRLVETARTSGNITEFRFTPAAPAQETGLLGLSTPSAVTGFGCGDPNALRVLRHSDNEISFPGCADFPNPLVRCQSR